MSLSGEPESRPGVIDCHFHLQDLQANYYSWLCDLHRPPPLEGDLTPIRRSYLLSDYRADLADFAILKAVHVENGWDRCDPVGETRFVQAIADADRLPNAIVAYADLAAADAERVLAAHCAYPAVRGIRQILNWHDEPRLRSAPRPDLMRDAQWRRGFALLRKYELSFDLQIYWPQMQDALDLARAFPDTTLVLDHLGMPIDASAEGRRDWAKSIRHLAQAENVVVKISGLGLGRPGWQVADIADLVEIAIDAFGTDRAVFGSNLPVDSLFAKPDSGLRAVASIAARLSPSEQDDILVRNAERIYRI